MSAVQRLLRILIPSVVVLVVVGIVAAIVVSTLPSAAPGAPGGRPAASGSDAPREQEDDDFGTVLVYDVLDDGSLAPEPEGLALEIWEMFVRVAGIDLVAESLIEYHVGDSAESDTMAFVTQGDDPAHWILGANLATSEDRDELLATLVHEYAHILFLGSDEIDPEGDCGADEAVWEGCPVEGSVIGGFRDVFWSGYGDDAPAADNTDADIAYDFYLAHEDDFVSDYAATNPVEDLAESFTAFVLEAEPDGDGVVAEKLRHLWEHEWLVEIRERIRAEFSGEHGLP